MSKVVHFKLNASTMTPCRKLERDIPVNINWNKVTCRECLMINNSAKDKRQKGKL